MNKAFVREPDPGSEFCPRCGSEGQPVLRETIVAQLPPASESPLAVTANFCPQGTCEVAYFDMFERVILVSELRQPVFPKDPDAPICACFQFTAKEIDQDIAEGVVTRTKELLAKAKSDAARCAQLAPNGRSCVAEVQRYYMQHRNP
jgi:bacterioferritin-associated ferredoxin